MRTGTGFLAAACLAALSLVAGAARADGEKVIIGTEGTYPPFNTLQADGTLTGFDIDIARALCDEMKVACTFVTQEWDGLIPALQAKTIDAIVSSMSITPERREKVDFTDTYYNTGAAIAVPKGSTLTDATDASLDGKTIGAQGETTHASYVGKHLPRSVLKLYPNTDEYKLDLANGRLDGVVDDVVVLSEWVTSPAGACCRILARLPIDIAINGPGAGIAVRKGDTALAEKFNVAIKAIRANGTYKAINDRYFDIDVYGD